MWFLSFIEFEVPKTEGVIVKQIVKPTEGKVYL